MQVPKINFILMTLQENIEIIKWAYFEKDELLGVHNYTIKCFPELNNIDEKMSKEKIEKIIENVVTIRYNESISKIEKDIKRYYSLWESYNDKYLTKLTEFLEIDWPQSLKTIEAKVGLIPIFPRFLDSFSFAVTVGIEDWKIIEICAHETLHFLWFEKWKKIHPETPREEFESPYLVWQYSEMVTDPILNNTPFNIMFEFQEKGYQKFYEIYDNNVLVMDKLREIYKQDSSINNKINKGFEYIKEIILKNKK